MNMKTILFPTDFSTPGDAGMSYATSLARDSGAMMIILHVEEPPPAYGSGEMYYGVPEPDNVALKKMLEAVVPTDNAVPFRHRLVTGDPATEIVRVADEEGVDLIIMGTHGRTGLKRLLMGSVAEAVVRRAKCPVFTFKPPHGVGVEAVK
jgi:nucleotide-binding universal stress UspA family protein